MPTTAAVIGTGPDPENPTQDGFGMGYRHADGYVAAEDSELVACADLVPENAAAFADEYGIPDDAVYEDYQLMLAEVEPDVVSVCVPPAIHAELVVDCARSGVVDAVHCEKPMALTWGGARLMAQEAHRRNVQLTFNHQRRYKATWRAARRAVAEGRIGRLERIELSAPNVYDWGSHVFDFAGMVTGEQPPEWVLAGLDYREADVKFGTHNENQAVVQWEYADGVDGLATTGYGSDLVGRGPTTGPTLRARGTDGTLAVGNRGPCVLERGGRREELAADEHDFDSLVTAAVADVVDALGEGREPGLGARNALNATEIVFAAWESVRRRGRVDCPLEIGDNPLEAMVEAGDLTPE